MHWLRVKFHQNQSLLVLSLKSFGVSCVMMCLFGWGQRKERGFYSCFKTSSKEMIAWSFVTRHFVNAGKPGRCIIAASSANQHHKSFLRFYFTFNNGSDTKYIRTRFLLLWGINDAWNFKCQESGRTMRVTWFLYASKQLTIEDNVLL